MNNVWVQGLIFTVLGAILSLVLPLIVTYFQNKKNRQLYGIWHIAFQAPYYDDEKYNFSKAVLKNHFLGIKLITGSNKEDFIWSAILKLYSNAFLYGKWSSKRVGSKSTGYLSLQISSNGKYIIGYIYGVPNNKQALIGRFLMSRDKNELKGAYEMFFNSEKDNPNLY